jgi:hypothetical protein
MPIVWKSPALARLLRVPYVPVTANMFLFGPMVGLVAPLPAKFKLRVLPPVTFDVEPNQERYNRSMVLEHADAVRESIQEAVFDMLRKRRSIWFG